MEKRKSIKFYFELKLIILAFFIKFLFGETGWRESPQFPNVYRSYQTSIYCNASSPIQYPRNASELQQIIQEAIASGRTVKVIGGLYSVTDIICTNGIPISTKYLHSIRINHDNSATLGSGIQLKDALEYLHKFNLTFEHIPTYGGITVGGAIAVGAHGSSLLHPTSLSDQLIRLTLINGNGQLQTIEKDDIYFKAFGVNLGLLGAIVNVTLRTVPLFKIKIVNIPEADNILFDGRALNEAKVYDFYQMWWFPSSKTVIVSRGNYTDVNVKGEAVTNFLPEVSYLLASATKLFFEVIQSWKLFSLKPIVNQISAASLYKSVVGKPPIFSEVGDDGNTHFVNPAIGYGHRLMSNRCDRNCAWEKGIFSLLPEESAMAFDIKQLPQIAKMIKKVLKTYGEGFPLVGIFIRFSKSSNNLMSIASGRDTVHIEWATAMRNNPYQKAKAGITSYQAILQSMVKDFGGRPHWGKNGQYYFNPDILQSQYSLTNLNLFRNISKIFDPNGIFLNKFGKRILSESYEMDVDPLTKHCALQDQCVCQNDDDCGDRLKCTYYKNGIRICEAQKQIYFT